MSAPLSIYKLIGKGYEHGWWTNCHCRYRVFAGARNTKKSYDLLGVEILDKIMSQPLRNILVLRKIMFSNRYSTFSTLEMLINQPDPSHPEISLNRFFHINRGAMTITYLPTGQMILFDGMQNPTRLTSMRMSRGYLTDVYVEEAYEITDYEMWRRVDGTIRGKLPEGYFHQITFVLNPWNKNHWIYEHFFKDRLEDDVATLETHDYIDWCDPELFIDYGKGLYLHKSTFRINEFRDKDVYDKAMLSLKEHDPKAYQVEALGCWGNATGATYDCWNDDLVIPLHKALEKRYCVYSIGIDFGISNGAGKPLHGKDVRLRSATTMSLSAVTDDCKQLIPVDEYFYSNEQEFIQKTGPELQNEMIATLVKWRDEKYRPHPDLMKGRICVYVDCADSGGFRQGLELEARKQGLYEAVFLPSTKISILSRVDFTNRLMAYGDFTPTDQCPNLVREIKNARYTDTGEPREDFDDHAINANEYAWAPMRQRIRLWKDFKER